ncbi:hypothetical protein PAL_GLEAN10009453 [Pteropus alecto]|uniref:Uncharacterized protein n=1 Tax=Pteropus alecto TaxID=9402 RepID=L5L5B7_PTEAL|nr:hypothetical protein PAL_GLEAN10009453 [Pteropus alecto]
MTDATCWRNYTRLRTLVSFSHKRVTAGGLPEQERHVTSHGTTSVIELGTRVFQERMTQEKREAGVRIPRENQSKGRRCC